MEVGYIRAISHESVRQVLKKNELNPHKRYYYVIPPERSVEFVYHMERVLEVYKRPYDPRYPVICLDESPKQWLSETQTPVRLADGTLRVDYTYQREGTCDIYMVCEPLAGWARGHDL